MTSINFRTMAAIAALALALPAKASLVSNGSFEAGTGAPSDYVTVDSTSTAQILDWTVVDGDIQWIGSYWQPSDLVYSIDLNGSDKGTISTSFGTTMGKEYIVRFYMAGNPDGNDAILKTLTASVISGVSVADEPFSFNTTGTSLTDMGWMEKAFNFIAQGTTTTLTFASTTDDTFFGPALDNVRVNAAPIPAGIWLLGSSLLGFLALGRKRNAA